MSKDQDIQRKDVQQIESVYENDNPSEDLSFKNYTEKQEQKEREKKKNIFIRFKDSIYHKPEKTENAWKLLTNLTNTQRITFAAGRSMHVHWCEIIFMITAIIQHFSVGLLMPLIFFLCRYQLLV